MKKIEEELHLCRKNISLSVFVFLFYNFDTALSYFFAKLVNGEV